MTIPTWDSIGVKGIGEIGTTGVAAAIANAVFHATGIRVRDLPITLDKLLTRGLHGLPDVFVLSAVSNG